MTIDDRLVPIDGTKPLHRLDASVRQLTFMKQHCESLLAFLNVIMERTYSEAPSRQNPGQTYELGRTEKDDPSGERLLEKLTWMKWNADVKGQITQQFLGDACRFILTYQMPLQGTFQDQKWGKVDLVGVSEFYLPVVIELKIDRGDDKSNDTPLRMLVEGISYAIAVRKAWNEGPLRTEWQAAMKKHGRQEDADRVLKQVPVVLLAPIEFWNRAIGQPGMRSRGKVKDDAWTPFCELVQRFEEYGFPVHFAELEIQTDGNKVLQVSNVSAITVPCSGYR